MKHKHHADAESDCGRCRSYARSLEHFKHQLSCFEKFRSQHPKVPDSSKLHVLCDLTPDVRRPQDYKFALPGSPVYRSLMRTDDYGDYGTIPETRERFRIHLEMYE